MDRLRAALARMKADGAEPLSLEALARETRGSSSSVNLRLTTSLAAAPDVADVASVVHKHPAGSHIGHHGRLVETRRLVSHWPGRCGLCPSALAGHRYRTGFNEVPHRRRLQVGR
ncbi:MAG: hypothetical protein WED09_14715 [Homoserinimonas sp.]